MTYFYAFFPEFLQNFTTHIPGRIESVPRLVEGFWGGDHWQVFYLSWKLLFNITNSLNPLQDPLTFASALGPTGDHEIGLQFAFVALCMKMFGATAGYNFAFILLPKLLTLLTSWFLCSQVTKNRVLAMLGALTLFLLPQTLHQTSWGHSGGAIFWMVPLGAAFICRHAQAPQRTANDWLAGITIFALVHADQHQSFYLLMLAAFAILLHATTLRLRDCKSYLQVCISTLKQWQGLIVMTVVTMLFGMILDKILMTDATSGGSSAVRTFGEIRHYSRPAWEFVRMGSDVLFPWVMLVLSIPVAIQFRRQKLALALSDKILLFGGGGFSILMLGMGPKGDWMAEVVSLPYRLLYYILPYFNYQRVPDKMAPIAAALLIAAMLSLVEKLAHPNAKRFATGALLLQISLYLYQPATTFTGMALERTTALSNELVAAIQSEVQPNEIILPLPTYFDGRAATYSFALTYATQRRSAEGYHGFAPPHYIQGEEARSMLERQLWNEQVTTYLKSNGITHLLIDFQVLEQKLGKSTPTRDSWATLESLKTIFCVDSVCLYRLQI